MAQIRVVRAWDAVPGRKQEYAAFITGEFLPAMKASGLGADSVQDGW
ncbi:MAG: hypothetical protein R6V46_17630 [Desulfatiglandaceae bacterium]